MAGSGSPTNRMTYSGYLRLEELLQLQAGPEGHSPSPSNDEIALHYHAPSVLNCGSKQVRAELDCRSWISLTGIGRRETLATDCPSLGASHRNLPSPCQSMESHGNAQSPGLPCVPG